jgi:hypothetical protein
MFKLFGKAKKKGQIQNLESLIMGLVIIGFLLIIGLALMGKARDTTTTNTAEYNASVKVINAMAGIPDWLTVIVLAFIAVIVLGVIYMIRRNN